MILPPSAGIPGHPDLIVAAGKSGQIFLVDRDTGKMGEFNANFDNVLNAVPAGSPTRTPPNQVNGSLSTPAYFNGELYWSSGYSGQAYSYTINSNGTLTAVSETAATLGYLPGSIEVSANGTLNGIVWVADRNANKLRAYNANSFSTELWDTGLHTGNTDALSGQLDKMSEPTIANGEVFVPTSDSLDVYGLNAAANAPPNAPVLTATALSGSSINLTWTDSTVTPNTASSYSIEESTDNVHFSVITTTPAGSTAIAIGGLFPDTKYYFRMRGLNADGYSNYSATASATTTNAVTGVNFSGGFSGESGLTLNGSAAVSGSSLVLTNGGANQASSVFSTSAFSVTGFVNQFTFQTTSGAGTGEGLTFTFQGVGPTALGTRRRWVRVQRHQQ